MTPYAVQYKIEHEGVVYHETAEGFVTYLPDVKTKTMNVLELYIHPRYRGQGHGQELMEHAKEAAKLANLNVLTTHIDPSEKSSPALRNIFSKMGLKKHDKNLTVEFELYSQEIS